MQRFKTPGLELVAQVEATLLAPQNVARTAAGMREMIVITGGTVAGAINGTIVPGGADWAINHGDGTATIWARYAIRCNDGSLIMVTNSGVVREQADGSWQGHTSPVLEAGTGDLRHAVLVGALHAQGDRVHMTWWRVV